MCLACWDADKMEEKKRMGMNCDGTDMLTMTTDELKDTLTEEWITHNKSFFRVYRKAVMGMQGESLSWQATNPATEKSETLSVKFI